MGVNCEQVRESVSAALDGEAGPLPAEAVEAHLSECAACRQWQSDVVELHRRSRLSQAPVVPDLSEQVMAAVLADSGRRARATRRTGLRLGLALVGLCQLVIAGPLLLLGHDYSAPLHTAHEVGSFSVAVAAGLMLAAYRPRLAAGMVPIIGIIAGLLLLTAGSDLALGHTQLTEEAPHLLDVGGFLLLWRLSTLRDEDDGPAPLVLPVGRGDSSRRDLPPVAGL